LVETGPGQRRHRQGDLCDLPRLFFAGSAQGQPGVGPTLHTAFEVLSSEAALCQKFSGCTAPTSCATRGYNRLIGVKLVETVGQFAHGNPSSAGNSAGPPFLGFAYVD